MNLIIKNIKFHTYGGINPHLTAMARCCMVYYSDSGGMGNRNCGCRDETRNTTKQMPAYLQVRPRYPPSEYYSRLLC
jgi:hypothetical protein